MMMSTFLAVFFLVPLPHSSEQHNLQGKLRAAVDKYVISEETFPSALIKVSERFEVPMGIEWIKSPETLRSVNLSWSHTTANQIVESLTRQFGYELQVKDEIINVFPRGRLRDEHDLLNLRIKSFAVRDEYVEQASRRLQAVVKRTVTPPSPSPQLGEAGSFSVSSKDRKVNFALQNATVREILDQLSISSALKIWIVSYPEKATKTQSGFYGTAALHVPGPLADEDQPVWVFLPWGTPLSSLRQSR